MSTIGKILWQDLTVENAAEIKDFYSEVVGWTTTPVSQGSHNDYNVVSKNGEVVAGICHNKGMLADFPAQWLNYVIVEDVETCKNKCLEKGGKVLVGPAIMGKSNYIVIQDPAGAVLALMEE
jgi:predicted enzyme related to lactoylglutathione lyase